MITKSNDKFKTIRKKVSGHSKILNEISSLYGQLDKSSGDEKSMVLSQIQSLQKTFREQNDNLKPDIENLSMARSLESVSEKKIGLPSDWQSLPDTRRKGPKISKSPRKEESKHILVRRASDMKLSGIEKETLKRLKRKEDKKKVKKKKRASSYVALSNKFFSGYSRSLLEKGFFKGLQRNLVKANIQMLDRSFISVILFSTLVSFFLALLIYLFFLFFNFGVRLPFITPFQGNIFIRAIQMVWILFIIPIGSFIFVYTYPFLERKSNEVKINSELPFATIHMASIAESKIEPSNIFRIMVDTGEYPHISKELIKLMNEINVFGKDLVTALRTSAYNSPSKKLAELFDGLATTITSGGELSEFFEKRAGTLLFDYRLDKEKQTKSAETFMDIYISVVIAAPMILMLLLILIRISGLGIQLSTGMISLIMILGVSLINVIFLVFLQLKSQGRG